MELTQDMKKAGATIILRELGAQFTPDWFDGEEIASRVFDAMLASAPMESAIQVTQGNQLLAAGAKGNELPPV